MRGFVGIVILGAVVGLATVAAGADDHRLLVRAAADGRSPYARGSAVWRYPVEPIDMKRPRLTPQPQVVYGTLSPTIDLNGTWAFNPDPPAGFEQDSTSNGWTTIQVPGQWSMQGFEVPGDRAVGYRRTIAVPDDWHGTRIKLRCDAVYGLAKIWVNGLLAGESERTFTPFELDVTELVEPGRANTIALSITNDCVADMISYGQGYARHQLGGIMRDIKLFVAPCVHLGRLHVETTFDEVYEDATLRLVLNIDNQSRSRAEDLRLVCELTDPAGHRVGIEHDAFGLPGVAAGSDLDHTIDITVAAPARWHPEHPNLYTLTVSLERDGQPTERITRRIGFRQVEVRGVQLLVNGRPTKLRGINRHEAHPLLGRALREPFWRTDAELFKAANINYIRTSHYPPDERFIEICDEIGLFVEVEAPVIWAGHGAAPIWKEWNYTDERFAGYFARFVAETIERDRSHPSVIFWSLANESLWSENWERVKVLAERLDPTRPIAFHDQAFGGYNNQGSSMPIANQHYPGPDGAANYQNESARPILFGEYCHLNSYNRQELLFDPGVRDAWGEALAPMWDSIYESGVVVGGAIWSGITDRFYVNGQPVGYDSWGPIDGWRRKKPEWWHVFKSYSPVRVLDRSINLPEGNEPVDVRVENRFEWTNLSGLDIRWRIGDEQGDGEADVAPGERGLVTIRPSSPIRAGQSLDLTFYWPDDRIVNIERLQIGTPAPAAMDEPAAPPLLTETDDAYEISAAGVRWVIDRATGLVRCVDQGDHEIIGRGPLLHLAPHLNTHTLYVEQFEPGPPESAPHFTNWRLTDLKVIRDDHAVVVSSRGRYDQAEGVFTFRFNGLGAVLDYEFTYGASAIDVRELGIVFETPALFDRLSWERVGQWTAYPGDHIGRTIGTARAFRDEAWPEIGPTARPPWGWFLDSTTAGTNDFRSGKRNIRSVRLEDADRRTLSIGSDGTQSARAWVSGGSVKLMIAEYIGPGSERFLGSYHTSKLILEPGSLVAGTIRLSVSVPAAR